MTDLTDYTEAWLMNAASGADEPGVISVTWPQAGGLPSTTGHVEDPASSFLGRGAFEPIGGVTNDRYLTRANSTSDIFDIRGVTSMLVAGWVKVDASATEEPYFVSIHDPSGANKQAFWGWMIHNTLGANPAPGFGMLDGLSAFNSINVQASAAVAMVKGTWQFVAGGFDSVRNKIFHFWGRAVGEHYYKEVDGFAAGFGYDGTSHVGLAKFKAGGGNGADAKGFADQVLFFNGRAATEDDLVFLWNNHVGRPLDDLISPTERGRTIAATLTCRPIIAATLTCRPIDAKNV